MNKSYFSLADIAPGKSVKVTGFGDAISPERHAHLQAYGIIPGRMVRVLQHSPVTVVQIDNTELAFENELAKEIQIQDLQDKP